MNKQEALGGHGYVGQSLTDLMIIYTLKTVQSNPVQTSLGYTLCPQRNPIHSPNIFTEILN